MPPDREQLLQYVVNMRSGLPYDVRCDRQSIWGNPFIIGRDGNRLEVVQKYEQYLLRTPSLLARLSELKGKRLGCWCAPLLCHCEVLVRYANAD